MTHYITVFVSAIRSTCVNIWYRLQLINDLIKVNTQHSVNLLLVNGCHETVNSVSTESHLQV